MKKILLFGSAGQMASEFAKIWQKHPEIELIQAARPKVDFLKPEMLKSVVLDVKPDIIVNAAAYTAVDLAETERDQAMRINADSVSVLGEAAKKRDALVIHFSTDYVFDGTKVGAYLETDPVNPINYYGLTKLNGEQALDAAQCDAFIFRVQWLYGEFGKNFYKTMQRLFETRESVSVVNDQTGAPTNTAWLAKQIDIILKEKLIREKKGLYHLAPSGSCTWYEFAKAILEREKELGRKPKCQQILPIATSDYPTPAKRPRNSVMECGKWDRVFRVDRDEWGRGILIRTPKQ